MILLLVPTLGRLRLKRKVSASVSTLRLHNGLGDYTMADLNKQWQKREKKKYDKSNLTMA